MRQVCTLVFLLTGFLPSQAAAASQASPALAATWRAVLASPGGELPFTLRIDGAPGALSAVAVNGDGEARFDSVRVDGAQVVLRFDVYDSEIRAELSPDGRQLAGEWSKAGKRRLAFRALRDDARRFVAAPDEPADAVAGVGGAWAVVFDETDGPQPARGEFVQTGTRVRGTFLTPVGDHRYLEGDFRDGLLRLSTFDGGHAFLYHARVQPDGTLRGEFWSSAGAAIPWTARPIGAAEADGLPDVYAAAGLTNAEGRLRFTFPDVEGRPVSLTDARFRGKVVIVNIFGTWCPNCNDEAPLLRELSRRYGPRGLEIIGLAYEQTGDPETDRRSVRTFAQHYDLDHTLLLAGLSDRQAARQTLPDVSGVFAFPTTIFVDRSGRVRKIHSGFTGPATGARYTRLVAEFDSLIESLLGERAGDD